MNRDLNEAGELEAGSDDSRAGMILSRIAAGGGGSEPDDPPLEQIPITEAEGIADAEGVIRSGKLAGKSMWSAIWILSLPVLLQQTMAACVGLVDTIIAGRLPDDIVVPAMDAIGIGSYIIWFIGIAMTGLGIGGQAIIARSMGAGDSRTGERAVAQAMMLSVIWGAAVAVLLWAITLPLASLCNLTPEATRFLIQYVQVICLSMPLAGIMMVGSMCLHGAGETTSPSLIAVAVNICNILLVWAFSGVDVPMGGVVLHNPFPLNWNVYGIAAGTSLSYAVGAVMTLWVLSRGVKDLKLRGSEMRADFDMMRRIVRVGAPGFFESLIMWSVNLFVLMFIGMIANGEAHKDGLQGAHLIAVRWESFSFLPGFAMGTAAGALAGQYLGARNPRMARRAIVACTGIGMAIMGCFGIVFMTAGGWLTQIVSGEAVHLRETPPLLFICGTVQLFFAITMVTRQGLRGAGDTVWTFLLTGISSYGARLPAAWFFGVYLELGLRGIWIGLCGELIVRGLLFAWRFMGDGWTKLEV